MLLVFWAAFIDPAIMIRRHKAALLPGMSWTRANSHVNFDLSEDEAMLKAVAERFVVDRYDIDRRKRYLANASGFCADNWALLSELGLIGAPFSAESGGLGLDQSGIAIIFEALGRGFVVEPLIESILVAGGLFEQLASPELRQTWLDSLVVGEKRLALAHSEQRARRNPAWVETSAKRNGQGIILNGEKSLVPAGVGADAYIVSARLSGAPGDRDGIALFLVPADAPGVAVNPYRLVDGSAGCQIALRNVVVDEASCLGGGIEDIENVHARASIARSAEALGIMERIFADTLEYLRTRKQFGVALGTFQALQHRMTSQYAVLEQARSLLYLAVMADPADRASWLRAINGARAFIADKSIGLGHEMIQMHGGMGVTDELAIGQGHKRLLFLSRFPDDASAALDRYAGIAA
jgi:alkylation response protein AidB-like acyl-CoA dehydrogenase